MNETPANQSSLEADAREVVRRLLDRGFTAWWVGGCVRDRLLGLPLKDIDIATTAHPEDVGRLFEHVKLVGASFGVCIVPFGGGSFEVATFRRDGRYLDHRRPESVEYGSAEEDARRRDFTINAMLQDPFDDQVIDYVGGRADLDAKLIRCVGDPGLRFSEDALRLMRAVRFAARLGFEIERETWAALCRQAPTILAISPERIRDELTSMLMNTNPSRAFALLHESGLLGHVLPEIEAMRGVEQGHLHHPEGDVWEHTMLCLERLTVRTPIICWAMLLHDVAKPPTRTVDERGIHFFQHETVGAEMARGILGRLRFSNADIEEISTIVSRHMKFMHLPQMRESTLRRFLAGPTIQEDMVVHRADCEASNGRLDYWNLAQERLKGFTRVEEPVIPKPLLNGADLIRAGYRPGPQFSNILERVQSLQLDGELSAGEAALEWVKREYPVDAG